MASAITSLDGAVVLGATSDRPTLALRSGLRSTRRRLLTVAERETVHDSDDDAGEGRVQGETWAPRLTRRGLPRRDSREKAPASLIAKKQQSTSPHVRVSALPLTRTGCTDMLGDAHIFTASRSPLTVQSEVAPAAIPEPAGPPPAAEPPPESPPPAAEAAEAAEDTASDATPREEHEGQPPEAPPLDALAPEQDA